MQLSPPTTREDISGLCWIQNAKDPKNCFTHCNTFCTFCARVVGEVEVRDVSCCNSPSFSMTPVADWKAALSPSESLLICFCSAMATAFSNASFLVSPETAGGWGFKDWSPAAHAGLPMLVIPLRVLALSPIGDSDETLPGTLFSGTSVWVWL